MVIAQLLSNFTMYLNLPGQKITHMPCIPFFFFLDKVENDIMNY